jgi:hypothetical protein
MECKVGCDEQVLSKVEEHQKKSRLCCGRWSSLVFFFSLGGTSFRAFLGAFALVHTSQQCFRQKGLVQFFLYLALVLERE